MTSATILVLYYSRGGRTAALARQAARGVESAGAIARYPHSTARRPDDRFERTAGRGTGARRRTALCGAGRPRETDGLLLGSPTRFGNMAAPLKHFLDGTSELWLAGKLVDKPAGVFTASSSAHGGQESTLLSMTVPLLHHGMLLVGVPYTETALFETRTGGSPYGATHLATSWNTALSKDETQVAKALGARSRQDRAAARGRALTPAPC